MITDYAIPRTKVEQARQRDFANKSTTALTRLHYQARELFTQIANTGEGGEILLYALAQHFLGLPQILCKMDLKTSSAMHYHGADGVYASVDQQGILKLYWGESKVHSSVHSAIGSCFQSLLPFLLDPEGEKSGRERDLILLSDKADLNDPVITAALRLYFDRTSPLTNQVRYCGLALAAFDADLYPTQGECEQDPIVAAAEGALETWKTYISSQIEKNNLQKIEIHVLCIPLPSAEQFREAFLKALGK